MVKKKQPSGQYSTTSLTYLNKSRNANNNTSNSSLMPLDVLGTRHGESMSTSSATIGAAHNTWAKPYALGLSKLKVHEEVRATTSSLRTQKENVSSKPIVTPSSSDATKEATPASDKDPSLDDKFAGWTPIEIIRHRHGLNLLKNTNSKNVVTPPPQQQSVPPPSTTTCETGSVMLVTGLTKAQAQSMQVDCLKEGSGLRQKLAKYGATSDFNVLVGRDNSSLVLHTTGRLNDVQVAEIKALFSNSEPLSCWDTPAGDINKRPEESTGLHGVNLLTDTSSTVVADPVACDEPKTQKLLHTVILAAGLSKAQAESMRVFCLKKDSRFQQTIQDNNVDVEYNIFLGQDNSSLILETAGELKETQLENIKALFSGTQQMGFLEWLDGKDELTAAQPITQAKLRTEFLFARKKLRKDQAEDIRSACLKTNSRFRKALEEMGVTRDFDISVVEDGRTSLVMKSDLKLSNNQVKELRQIVESNWTELVGGTEKDAGAPSKVTVAVPVQPCPPVALSVQPPPRWTIPRKNYCQIELVNKLSPEVASCLRAACVKSNSYFRERLNENGITCDFDVLVLKNGTSLVLETKDALPKSTNVYQIRSMFNSRGKEGFEEWLSGAKGWRYGKEGEGRDAMKWKQRLLNKFNALQDIFKIYAPDEQKYLFPPGESTKLTWRKASELTVCVSGKYSNASVIADASFSTNDPEMYAES
jgi:hypothetical protein